MATSLGISQQVHPLEYLIGGPLQAMVRADALAAQSSLQVLEEIGFEQVRDKESPTLRMIEFTYTHPLPDPANPGAVIDTPTTVKVPLLCMLSLPNIAISEANIDFNVRIVGFTPIKKNEKAVETPVTRLLPSLMQSVFTSRSSSVGEPTGEPFTLSISLKIKKEVMPEAEKRILALLQDAIVSRPLKEERSEEKNAAINKNKKGDNEQKNTHNSSKKKVNKIEQKKR